MPYILKEFDSIYNKRIEKFLQEDVKLETSLINKLLEKTKVLDENNRRYQKNQKIKSKKVKLILFEEKSKGLKPLFETEHFAIFDKPSGIKVHPKTKDLNEYTLLDEIKHYIRDKGKLINRIDKETSGLVLVAKNDYAQYIFNEIFENRSIKKEYLALVHGEIKENITIDKKISPSNSLIKIKMETSSDGKDSLTKIEPLKYLKDLNQTVIKAKPITGRQHQIRVHLNSINHTIIGDPIYGLNENISDMILNKKLDSKKRIEYTKANRLMLHSYSLEFDFLGIKYKIVSKQNFGE